LPADIVREDEAALFVGSAMLRPGMELAQKDPAITGSEGAVRLGLRAHAGKLLFRHNKEILVLGMGQDDELLGLSAPPTEWDGDPVLLVNGMTKLSGKKFLGLRIVFHTAADKCAILIHFPPLLTTFRTVGQ
jgi:hypothetical protein